jgi:HEPN domain-containing protein
MCAERYLKALVQEIGLPIGRTSDLDDLLTALQPHYPNLATLRRGLLILNRYTIDLGYPGHSANRRQAISALRWAKKVRAVIQQLLGIPTARKKPAATINDSSEAPDEILSLSFIVYQTTI